jgi:microcystin-dependent protein
MALDFPNSPTDGQVFGDWVYSSADNAWRKNPTIPGGLPAGSIIQWGGSTAPSNWLLCDGSNVSRSTYASLFQAIGTTFGVGDGTSTFTLPDLRGRVAVGKNGGTFGTLGSTGGAETHVHGSSSMVGGLNIFRVGGETYFDYMERGVGFTENSRAYLTASGTVIGGRSEGAGSGLGIFGNTDSASSLSPYQVVNYIIKTTAATTADESTLTGRVGAVETAIATQITQKNHLHNGAFDVWQKGTSFGSSGGGISVDRWHEYTDSGSGTQSRDATITVPGVTQQTYKFLAGGSGSNFSIFQVLETQDSQELVGQTT